MIRFIHAADLHLDTPFYGLQEISKDLSSLMRKAPFESLKKIIDTAIEKEVDFVLLSGDLYNTQKINIKAQSIFIKELKRLKEEGIKVFLIRGNHDFLSEENKKLTLQLPDNVYLYSEEVQTHIIKTKENKKVAVSAFSYENQWIQERKIKEYPERFEEVDMHIGMLHGAIDQSDSSTGNYAPFSISELKEKNYDYWALGHIHQKQKISTLPLAYYPGNIQGLHKNERGEKGCLVLEKSLRSLKVEFVTTASIVWEELRVDLKDIADINQLINQVREQLIEKEITENYLIHLIIKVYPESDEDLLGLLKEGSFISDLTNQLDFNNLWITDIELVFSGESKTRSLANLYPNEWSDALEQAKNRAEFSALTEGILRNIANKYLNEKNTSDYRKKMIEKAISKIYLK